MNLHNNMSLREAIQVGKELGCRIEIVNRKGEIEFWHTKADIRFRKNLRKKDAGRGLVSWLRKLRSRTEGGE